MNILAIAFVILTAFLISSCSSKGDILSDDPQLSEIGRMSNSECKQTEYKQGWNKCSRHTAQQTYVYAQMAANAYDVDTFNLGSEFEVADKNYKTKTGLGYVVYVRRNMDMIEDVVISFRGTDFDSLYDWWFGNIGNRQRREALVIFDRFSEEYNLIPSVTGHSLGGALATQVSLCRDVHLNVVFDSSPRFSRKLCNENYLNRNYSIVELGEINYLFRFFGKEATQRYNSLGCLSEGGPINQHSMGKLAACLTNIAAIDDCHAMQSKIRNNIPDDADNW